MSPARHALIVGGSSALGQAVSARLLTEGYGRIDMTHARRPAGRSSGAVHWHQCDVTRDDQLDALANAALDRADAAGARLSVVYCCGAWRAGTFPTLGIADLRTCWSVGVDAPHRLAVLLARRAQTVSSFVLTTGMGGPANHLAGNSAYAIACDGATALIATLDAEMRARRGGFAAYGLQLGLVDKGQSWMADFVAATGLRPAPDFEEAAALIRDMVCGRLQGARGTMLALPGEISSYAALLAFRQGADHASPRTELAEAT